jgi:hypothetical protein
LQTQFDYLQTLLDNLKVQTDYLRLQSFNLLTQPDSLKIESTYLETLLDNLQIKSDNLQLLSDNMQTKSDNLRVQSTYLQTLPTYLLVEYILLKIKHLCIISKDFCLHWVLTQLKTRQRATFGLALAWGDGTRHQHLVRYLTFVPGLTERCSSFVLFINKPTIFGFSSSLTYSKCHAETPSLFRWL